MAYRSTLAGTLITILLFSACTPTGGRFEESLTILTVSPSSGSIQGNTHITISGKKFNSKSSVVIGGATCLNITIISDTEMVCDTPAHQYGVVDIVIVSTNDSGSLVQDTLEKAFEYIPDTPTISSINPKYGSTDGGTTITISGSNFLSGATVKIGESECLNVVVNSTSEISCVTPPNTIGVYDVTVNVYTLSATLTNGFQYQYIVSNFVDGNGDTSDVNVNYDSANGYKPAYVPNLIVYRNKLYAVWNEANNPAFEPLQIRIKVYNGNDITPQWTLTENQTDVTGLNYDTTKNTSKPHPLVFNDELYVTWGEKNASSKFQIRVARYNPTDIQKWKFVDGNGANGINKSTTSDAMAPKLFIHNSKLYCTWYEKNASAIYQIRVAEYQNDGATWEFKDEGEANGINFDTSQNANYPFGISFGGNIYVFWVEKPAGQAFYVLRVKKYDGVSWQVDDGGSSKGLNIANQNSGEPIPILHQSNLYVTWAEQALGQTYYQIRLAKRISANYWDKSISGSNGYNKVSNLSALNPFGVSSNSFIYLIWTENNASDNTPNVRILSFYESNTSLFIDGNSTYGINKNPTKTAFNATMALFNGKIYFGWTEEYYDSVLGRNVTQFRVRTSE